LPKEFRFAGDEVEIRREGECIILEPVKKKGWPPGYWEQIKDLRSEMDLGKVEPLPAKILDIDLDAE
jgi:virulence-associated protein VagC